MLWPPTGSGSGFWSLESPYLGCSSGEPYPLQHLVPLSFIFERGGGFCSVCGLYGNPPPGESVIGNRGVTVTCSHLDFWLFTAWWLLQVTCSILVHSLLQRTAAQLHSCTTGEWKEFLGPRKRLDPHWCQVLTPSPFLTVLSPGLSLSSCCKTSASRKL